ncbi:TlpA family protein disulfide reductase [Legionella septentrionalis]|uniref:TlpA family protein disulfide reductase n=1 Tax=Legionella septentrionalis TaxID=2498109 RepID=A0A433JMT2_9GAMM|nr:TlpA disulfide reductase family protein [Legionella septentrionalis]RUQ91041.1 TlpA family protein disulfide reductase [Legionella septentrionalis]RUR02889.1 TlpA family protein disulfide reductase [Legionella septentrionalis]RUR11488.1 TlpA family protein disulfide reductase [Legionella septentrionalis]
MRTRHFILTCFLSFFISTTVQAEVVLEDLHGQKIPFSALNGKWVFINYWASWCQPCIEEIPELNEFYERYKNDNVVIFGVNYEALPVAEQKQLVKEYDIRYPALTNDPATLLKLGDIRGVPVTFVFNPQGELSGTLYGGQTSRSLSQIVASR